MELLCWVNYTFITFDKLTEFLIDLIATPMHTVLTKWDGPVALLMFVLATVVMKIG